jgi:hypothetical protein
MGRNNNKIPKHRTHKKKARHTQQENNYKTNNLKTKQLIRT